MLSDGHNVGPDLDPKCLQRLSADDKSCRYLTLLLVITFIICCSLDQNQAGHFVGCGSNLFETVDYS